MENVLLLGGTGLLGTEIQKRWRPDWGTLTVAPRSVDITENESVMTMFGDSRPAIVINCAAASRVDEAETNPLKAIEINARGPEVLASACDVINATLIHLSTDYVFGEAPANRPFTEKDYPNPINEYGRSKWEGEKRAMMVAKHYVLRTSSLYGAARSNHAMWVLDALKTGKKIAITGDMVGSPTYVGELAEWIGNLIVKKPAFGIYHLCNTGWVSRYDFAEKLCELKKAKRPFPIEKVPVASLKLPAPRPHRPLLSMEKWQKVMGQLPPWEDGLEHFLRDQ